MVSSNHIFPPTIRLYRLWVVYKQTGTPSLQYLPMKEAVVMTVDMGRSMQLPYSDKMSRNTLAFECIKLFMQQKLFTESRHLFGLTLFGDDQGENGKSYTIHPMAEPKLEVVRQLAQLGELNVQNSLEGGDIFEALKFSTDLLHGAVGGKKFKKRMFLFTNGQGDTDYNKEDVKMLAEHIQRIGAKVNVIVIDFMEGYDDENNRIDGTTSLNPRQQSNSQMLMKLKELCPDNVRIVPASIAIELYREFRKKETNRTAIYRGPFEISAGLTIQIATYTETKEDKITPLKKYNAKKEFNKSDKEDLIQTEVLYYVEGDKTEELVESQNVISGYKYGNGLVPITEVVKEQMKIVEPKGMHLIGFVEKHQVPRSSFMGHIYKVIPGDDRASQKLFSAFIYSMLTLERYAICRHVPRNNKNGVNPKLVVLMPYKSSKGECFYMTDLPVSEDIREFPFNPLQESSKSEQQLVDELITRMDLMNVGEQEDAEEALKVHCMFNPTKQYLYQSLFHRSSHPDDELPPLDPYIREYISPQQQIYKNTVQLMAEVKAKFGLKEKEIKKKEDIKKLVWAQLIKDKEQELDTASTVADSSEQQVYWKKFNFEPDPITQLDPSDPIQSFNSMITYQKKDLVSKAIDEMTQFILNKMETAENKQSNSRLIIECLVALRKGCIKQKQEERWDQWLQSSVSRFSREQRQELKNRGLGFIMKSNEELFKVENGVLHNAQIKIEYEDLD